MKLPLVLAFCLAAFPALSQEAGGPVERRPAPRLTELSRALDQKLEDKKNAILTTQEYAEFAKGFRADLDDAIASSPPTAENKGLYAEILARLDGSGARALATLDEALKTDPKNPALLRSKAQVLYDQKNFPAAAEAARQAGATAEGLLKMSQGRSAGSFTPGTGTQARGTARVAGKDEDQKPYKLAVQAKLKPVEIPLESSQPKTVPKFRSNSPGLWGQAVDGLVMKGSEWVSTADAIGEDGLSGVNKLATKSAGKGLLMVGGLMDVAPGAATWAFGTNFRLMTGDVTVVPEIGRGMYAFGKTAVVGFVDDAGAATKDWGDLFTLKKPTTYQALKATARTEAILANFLPVGVVAESGVAGVETLETIGAGAGRRGLARAALFGGRELGEEGVEHGVLGGAEALCPPGSACGLVSRRPFVPAEAGGPIRKLSSRSIRVTHAGIDVVEKHIARFGKDVPNEIMVKRLRAIAEGTLAPEPQDLEFYSHELREYVRYRNLGAATGRGGDRALWNNAHTATLEEYGIKDGQNYHPEAGVNE